MKPEDLTEWALHYVRSRDAHFRKIQSIEEKGTSFLVKFDDKEVLYTAEPILKLENVDKDKNTVILTLNTKTNLKTLIKNWKDAEKIKGLTIYFLNLESTKDTKWIISPYVHSKICDDSALKTGLVSMQETVDIVKE